MTQDTTEISRAPPMRHHGCKMARRVSDTYEICNCFILSLYTNVLIYRNIHFSKIHLGMLKQKSLRYFGFSLVSYGEKIALSCVVCVNFKRKYHGIQDGRQMLLK